MFACKHLVEEGTVAEAAAGYDFRDGQFAVLQHSLGLLHPVVDDKVVGSGIDELLQLAVQLRPAHEQVFGQHVRCVVFIAVVLFKHVDGPFEKFLVTLGKIFRIVSLHVCGRGF